MFQLSGMDSMFFHLESEKLPMHISSCIIFKPRRARKGQKAGTPEFSEIRALFEKHLLPQVPILKCRLQSVAFNLDQPYWVEDEYFDLNFHLQHLALPKPGDWNALREMIGQMHSRSLDKNKPLWEATVIDGLDHVEGVPKGGFALFVKVHHSIMDGRTGRNIMTSLLSAAPDEPPITTGSIANDQPDSGEVSSSTFKKPGFTQKVSRAYVSNAKKTWRMTKLFTKKLPETIAKLELAKYRQEIKTIPEREVTCFNRSLSSQRVVNRIHLPLDEIKKIRTAVDGAKVNDVMLTIVGGALVRYLEAQGELPGVSLVAGAPVDVRGEEDDSVQGNMITFMNTSLCSNIDDPLERLSKVHEEAMNAKQFTTTLGHHTLYDLLDSVYPGLTAYGLRALLNSGVLDKLPPFANTVVSNVSTIPLSLYLAGAELIDSFGMGPLLPNMGLFHVVSGVNKTITLCFTACPHAMPDSELYARCLEDAYQELKTQAFESLEALALKDGRASKDSHESDCHDTNYSIEEAS